MKRFVTIALSVICGGCCVFADGVSDKYMDIACDWFSRELNWKRETSESKQLEKMMLLAEETSDPYDKTALEELVFIYSDPSFKENKSGWLSYFVSGPIWHVWPKRETIVSSIEEYKPIMDIDLACDMAYSARNFICFQGWFWDNDSEDIVTRKYGIIDKRMEHRKNFLDSRGTQANAAPAAIEWMRSNMSLIRRIFRAAERESAMVLSIHPSFKMYKFVWVVYLLGGRIERLVSSDCLIDWDEFAEIEDWFWINEYKIDFAMIEKALSLYSRSGLPLGEFNSARYERMQSDELYKEIVNQVAAKGIVPLRECDLSQFTR